MAIFPQFAHLVHLVDARQGLELCPQMGATMTTLAPDCDIIAVMLLINVIHNKIASVGQTGCLRKLFCFSRA